jgi:hypothetical protein
VAINPDVVQITHRVEQLERKVMHLGIIFNQTISSLKTEVANLNTAIKVAQNNTALVRINFKSMSKLEFCPFLKYSLFSFSVCTTIEDRLDFAEDQIVTKHLPAMH